MDYSLPGSAVHRIFQARVLEWGAIAFSALKCYTAYIHLAIEIIFATFIKLKKKKKALPFYSYWGKEQMSVCIITLEL